MGSLVGRQITMTYIGLSYLDWSVCSGGRHFTGHLTFKDRERVELSRRLSLLEAHEESAGQDYMYAHELPRVTNRFETWEGLVRAATNWCRANLKEPWLLLKHDGDGLYPVLASEGVPEIRVRMLNLVAMRWDQLANAERDSETMDAFYAAWKVWKP